MKKLIFCVLFSGTFLGLYGQDIIYTLSGNYNQSKIPLDSIMVENVTNGKVLSFGNLPDGDNYLVNLTKNSFGGTVDVYNLKKSPQLLVIENIPGSLKLSYNGSGMTYARLLIVNINGQVIYSDNKISLIPGNSIKVVIGKEGMFFVKIGSNSFLETFKVIGIDDTNDVRIAFSATEMKTFHDMNTKVAQISGNGDFSFNLGDSIRFWVNAKQKDLFAWPEKFRIKESVSVDFIFNDIYFPTKMEEAYSDSIGENIKFTIGNQTLSCKKINGDYVFQGDIILTENQVYQDSLKGASLKYEGLRIVNLWPEGKVYYDVDETLKKNGNIDERILQAITYWNLNTPVTFYQRLNELNYVDFVRDEEKTASRLGMTGLRQRIWIQDDATYGEIMHEMGHAIGLIHEHNRADRDFYVIVHDENIIDGKEDQFTKFTESICVGEFDFSSIMLYDSEAFAKKGCNCFTITKKDNTKNGSEYHTQRSYLSSNDIETIEILYDKNINKKPTVGVDYTIEIYDGILNICGKIISEGETPVSSCAIGWRKTGDSEPYFKHEYYNGTFNECLDFIVECGEEYIFYASASNSWGSASSTFNSLRIAPNIEIEVSEIISKSAKFRASLHQPTCISEFVFCVSKNYDDAVNNLCDDNGTIKMSNPLYYAETIYNELQPDTKYFLKAHAKYLFDDDYDWAHSNIIEFETNDVVKDIEGNVYETVKIGNQVWMAENLRTTKYSDGRSIPNITNSSEWGALSAGAYCWYDNITSNKTLYGALYNWWAAMDGASSINTVPSGIQGVCPRNWHLPSENEWIVLKTYLTQNGYGYLSNGEDISKSLAGRTNWNYCPTSGTPGNDPSRNNASGFSGFPFGRRNEKGEFVDVGNYGFWWTATACFPTFNDIYRKHLGFQNSYFTSGYSMDSNAKEGYSIRCIKD